MRFSQLSSTISDRSLHEAAILNLLYGKAFQLDVGKLFQRLGQSDHRICSGFHCSNSASIENRIIAVATIALSEERQQGISKGQKSLRIRKSTDVGNA